MTQPTDAVARTVGAVLRLRAAQAGDRLFLGCDDERLTYREAHQQSGTLAKGLVAAGAGRGSHIGLLMPNGADFAIAAFAAMRIGAVVVPMSTTCTAAELRTLIDRSDVEIVLAAQSYRSRAFDQVLAEAIDLGLPATPPVMSMTTPTLRRVFFHSDGNEPLVFGAAAGWTMRDLLGSAAAVADDLFAAVEADVVASDTVTIVHTSGSTSAPKGVVHTHGALLDHLRVLNDLRSYRPEDVLFSNSPFFWIGGFAYTFLGTLLAGATLVCSRAADPSEVLDVIERERPTMVNGYAASAAALAAHPSFAGRDLSSIRRGNLYALMPDDVRPADPQLRPNLLGMTEGGSVVLASSDESDLPESLRGSFGRPVPDLEGRVVERTTHVDCPVGEQGELWLRGPALMQGYYGVERFAAFDENGWFRTGDVVRTDESGHWYFLGRNDDVIKTAGANVSPAEVQDAILAATGLSSYVFGLPDPGRGQVVAAALVLDDVADAAGSPDAAQLRAALAPLLSAYKIPRVVRGVASSAVPLRSSGKVDMGRLVELFSEN